MSFISPLFLFALSAAVLPVLFHFVRKMRAKKVMFSSLMFLKATPKELIKRRRLRDLLLMCLRAAIFALLAFAFARPFLPDETLPFVDPQEDRSVVILLDQSYSMQASDLFERARQAALDRLAVGGPDDEFSVIVFSNVARQVTAFSTDRALHRNVLADAVDVSYRPTDFYEPLRLADEVLREARHEDRTVVLVSDFQQAGWSGSLENWKLGPDVTFEPIKVAADDPANAFVDDLSVTARRVGPRVAVRYDARVAADDRRAGTPNHAVLSVDGAPLGEQDLAPLASNRVSFQQVAPREGFFQGMLALEDDDLAADNHFYFTYDVAGRPSLLIVDDAPRSTQRDAFFLEKAFDLGETALYDVSIGGRDRLARGALSAHELVFLANPRGVTAAQRDALEAYVTSGGSVVVSFGEATDLASAGNALQALGVGRLDGRVSARAIQSAEAIIGEVDLRHPIFDVFAGAGRGAILRPRFRQFVRLVPDSAATVIGRYDSGDPFLVERRLGQGKILVYTSTFNTRWTDFPINEMYVPFLYQVARYAVSDADVRHQYFVGDAVAITGRPGAEWDVRTPENEIFKVTLDATGTGFFRETERPGHYVAAQGRNQFPFSVNVDPGESDLRTRDEEQVYASVVAPSGDAAAAPEEADLAVEDEEKRQKLWRYIILLVVALFALETYLANRRTRTAARPMALRS